MAIVIVVMAIAFFKVALVFGPFMANDWFVHNRGLHGNLAIAGWTICGLWAVAIVYRFRNDTSSSIWDDFGTPKVETPKTE